MKKRQLLLIAALSMIMITDSAFSKQIFAGSKTTVTSMYNYTWFTDPDLTNPTGSEGTVGEELERLRDEFPAYVFTAVPSMGLHTYEWGYYPNQMYALIYSNKP